MAAAKVSMPPIALPMRMPARWTSISLIASLPSEMPAAKSACHEHMRRHSRSAGEGVSNDCLHLHYYQAGSSHFKRPKCRYSLAACSQSANGKAYLLSSDQKVFDGLVQPPDALLVDERARIEVSDLARNLYMRIQSVSD